MAKSNRDLIRSKTIGRQKQFRFKIIDFYPPIYTEITDSKGNVIALELLGNEEESIKVGVRQPTIRERRELVAACRNEDGSFDEALFIVQAAIKLTFDPDTRESLYEATDVESLLEMPTGDFPDQFGEEAMKMLSIGDEQENFTNSKKTVNSK